MLNGTSLIRMSRDSHPHLKEVCKRRENRLKHYQKLSDSLVWHIRQTMERKMLDAAHKGYGWTNIFQYFPTNHPLGNDSQKYWAGVDHDGVPIPSTVGNGGVPVILLLDGPKVGEKRDQTAWIAQGFQTVKAQLHAALSSAEIRLYQRWTGKGGYVIEAVWDHDRYQHRIDMATRRSYFKEHSQSK